MNKERQRANEVLGFSAAASLAFVRRLGRGVGELLAVRWRRQGSAPVITEAAGGG